MDISCQLVIGPPNSGKSKYCAVMSKLYETFKQEVAFINLDPGADNLEYVPNADIREFACIEDFADGIGLSAATEACLELLLHNIEWLTATFDSFQDGTVFIDCPGITSACHSFSIISSIVHMLVSRNIKICYTYIIDSHVLSNETDVFAACVESSQVSEALSIPGINVCNNLEELEEEHANFLLECFQWDVLKERIKKSAKHVPKNMFDVCFKLVNLKFSSETIDDFGNQEDIFIPLNVESFESVAAIDNLFKLIVDDKNDLHDYLVTEDQR